MVRYANEEADHPLPHFFVIFILTLPNPGRTGRRCGRTEHCHALVEPLPYAAEKFRLDHIFANGATRIRSRGMLETAFHTDPSTVPLTEEHNHQYQ